MKPKKYSRAVQEAQDALDELVRLGVAWKGADGRYRLTDETGVAGRA